MRARMALYYSQQSCELREVVLKHKPPQMLAVSQKGTVPVLVLGEGPDKIIIDESLELMNWALTQHDPDLWIVDVQSFENPRLHPLLELNDGYFTHWLNRYKYADRYPEASQLDYFEKCCVFLHQLEDLMVQTEDDCASYFINSPTLTFLDVAIFPFVRQCFAVDTQLVRTTELPKLRVWHDTLISSDLFISIMTKYPMWTAQQTEVVEFGPKL